MSMIKKILDSKHRDVYTIPSNTPAIEALQMMDSKGVGVLIIVDNETIEGIFTEGDYISRVLLNGLERNTPVSEVMTKKVQTITPDQTVNKTMQIMIDKDIRYFPVVNQRKLLGVISVGDCIKEVIAEQEEIIEHLEHYIQG